MLLAMQGMSEKKSIFGEFANRGCCRGESNMHSGVRYITYSLSFSITLVFACFTLAFGQRFQLLISYVSLRFMVFGSLKSAGKRGAAVANSLEMPAAEKFCLSLRQKGAH